MIALAAGFFALACLGVIGFQIALILGAPWGRLTQGGTHAGALPVTQRVFAAVSAGLMAAMAAAVLAAAGIGPDWPRWTGWTALAVTGIVAVLNWITPSRAERRLWGPVTTAMLAASLYVMAATGG